MKRARRGLILPLIGLLSAAMLFTSCDKTPAHGHDDTTAEESTAAAETTYKVTVQESNGTLVSDVILKVQQNGADVTSKVIGPTGTTSFTLPTGEYTLLLDAPSGATFYFNTEEAVLTPEAPELVLTVYYGISNIWNLGAPSKNDAYACQTCGHLYLLAKGDAESGIEPGTAFETLEATWACPGKCGATKADYQAADGYVPFEAGILPEGTTYVELSEYDHTYLLFKPTRAGVYKITCSEGVDFSYHGMPILVYDEPRISPKDGAITIPVEASSLGDDSISQLVFRLNAAEGSAATDAFFTIERTGDIIKSEEELAPWITIEANSKDVDALATFKEPAENDPWFAVTSGKLTDVDLAEPDLTVVLGTDGYYHYGTADGPIVFLRIASDSQYVSSFAKMCETDHLRAYFYDENDKFLRKEGYNNLVNTYAELANSDGVVPMTEQLAYFVQNVGRHMGWWNFEQNSDIFGDEIFDTDIAWLFACAYYK